MKTAVTLRAVPDAADETAGAARGRMRSAVRRLVWGALWNARGALWRIWVVTCGVAGFKRAMAGRRIAASGVRRVSVRRAAALSAVLVGAGTALGFVRDLLMAHTFGAGRDTDAFLIGWMIPETASPLLIEDAMALLAVPLVTRALRGAGSARPLAAAVLPRLVAVLAVVAGALAVGAPLLVAGVAPGLADPHDAVRCVRIAAVTVVMFGVAGFMSATLRAHGRFGPPAAIYLAYNAGIVASIVLLQHRWGVMSAAAGVAVGSVLMVAVQAPAFARCLGPARRIAPDGPPVELLTAAALLPVVAFTLARQAQVFVERFLGSGLAAGSISELNYAQKVAQVPMVLSLLVVTVTFPRLARASADADVRRFRDGVERDVLAVSALILAATAFLVACGEDVVTVLFRHGAFGAADTEGTARIMRVYAFGLWGQTMVGVAARAFFARRGPMWRPALATALGLALTVAVGALGVASFGAPALAAANAAGITAGALVMLAGVRSRVVPIRVRVLGAGLARLGLAAGAAGAAGLAVRHLLHPALPPVAALPVCGLAVAGVYAALLMLPPAAGIRPLAPVVPFARRPEGPR
ncbi:lipid II flippase MurJ [Actinomadura atramentaria]|uniref:lipid II flippase MurJ n=1 Tax=Actinomadura atramentaria TaxID=1990 RepID=UPI0003700B38|nr:lipid II flippase MurJ [Actinomadura atramentaria]